MFNSKSFHLNHELDTNARKKERERKRLREPKRTCWMKFIVITLLGGFALLLVLSNVDFSGESTELTAVNTTYLLRLKEVSNELLATKVAKMEEVLDGSADDDINARVADIALQDTEVAGAKAAAYASFTCTDNRSCKTVVCSGGPIYTLIIELEYFINWCGNEYFDLTIENCTFDGKSIDKYTMSGSFNLNSLTIRNCSLEKIVDNAFKYSTVQKLVNLTLQGVQLQSLNANSFAGLGTVTHFKLLNTQQKTSTPLIAENFLQPMAAKLSSIVLQQSQENCDSVTIYDPTGWLGGSVVYGNLTFVDLSGTHFNHTLNRDTFIKLSALHELSLANCSLRTIAESTFDGILETLKLLDLRNNQLETLDGEFLAIATLNDIGIQMAGNEWRCDCDNIVNIEYVKQRQDQSGAAIECASPVELKGVQMRDVQLQCEATTANTPLTTATTALPTLNSTMSTTITTTNTTPLLSSTPISTSPTNATENTSISRSTGTSLTTTTLNNSTLSTHMTASEVITTTPLTTDNVTSTVLWPTTTSETIVEDTTDTTLESTTTMPKTTTTKTSFYTTTTPPWQTTTTDSECYSDLSPKFIVCKYTKRQAMCDYDGSFNVYTTSSTSVQLRIGNITDGLQVTYFQALSYNVSTTHLINSNSSMDINHLAPNQSYVFCLIPVASVETSPFNCRSAHLPLETAQPWLENSDRALFYTIATLITVICSLIGVAAVYFSLRWRPTLIYGNKRIRRINYTSHKIWLLAKTDRSSIDSKQLALNELSKMPSSISDTLSVENYLDVKSYDYMQYFKGLEFNKQRNVPHISDNRPPLTQAPTLPPVADRTFRSGERDCHSAGVRGCNSNAVSHHSSQQSTVRMEGVRGMGARFQMRPQNVTMNEFENEYESIDYYQELY
ncbi:uncharacterized protein LOC128867067 [Anastrepha ludens]|uniref:uncharacterized protein LOC128867067 n=1 Tax=Anastrepha ludens TaxID=28586 RepID=UPI0023B033C7|nr:uncharacterized protein LOC128867067 [Anastrepha ludens]